MVRVHLTRCVAFFFLRFCPAAGVRVCVRAPVTRAVKMEALCLQPSHLSGQNLARSMITRGGNSASASGGVRGSARVENLPPHGRSGVGSGPADPAAAGPII